MRLSQSGLELNKIGTLDKMFPAQDLLLQTGQLVQYESGIFAYNNIPLRALKNIESVIKAVFDQYGFVEVLLPTIQPQSIWQESGRWDKYIADGEMLTIKTDKGNYCMSPTAEEAVTIFVKNRTKSYKSLPVTLYQISEKYRNEIRARGYLMRGKAFSMMDAYSFDIDDAGLQITYEKMREAYMEIFRRLGLDIIAVAADPGAIGGSKSEEFMFIHESGGDRVLINKKTGKAYNIEMLEREGIKDLSQYDEKRAIELGHIFQLGKKYSESMNATFINADGKPQHFVMGCYGIGVSRTLAVIYENSILKDAKGNITGITLPRSIAPYKVQIIYKPEKESAANILYQNLQKNGVDCIFDDRAEVTLGAKIHDAKKLGMPYIVILGDKTKDGEVEVENTRTTEKKTMTQTKLARFFNEIR